MEVDKMDMQWKQPPLKNLLRNTCSSSHFYQKGRGDSVVLIKEKFANLLKFHANHDSDMVKLVHCFSTLSQTFLEKNKTDEMIDILKNIDCETLFSSALRISDYDRTNDKAIDISAFLSDYMELLKFLIKSPNLCAEKFKDHLVQLQCVTQKLVLNDVHGVGRVVWEIYEIQSCFYTKQIRDKSLNPEEDTNIPIAVETFESRDIGWETDLEQLIKAPSKTNDDLRNLLDFIANCCREGKEMKMRVISYIDRNASIFPLQELVQFVKCSIVEITGDDLLKTTIDFFQLLKRMCRFGGVVINDIQNAMPHLHKITTKLVKNETIDVGRILWLMEKIQRHIFAKRASTYIPKSEGDPPENFRKLSIVPRQKDVVDKRTPYLRQNIIKGPYDNLEHYLDVQFRLMREDMLSSFRNCVFMCRQKLSTATEILDNGRMFANVIVDYPPVFTVDGLIYSITIRDMSLVGLKSKSLKPGSLVCLSYDNFLSLTFATILSRMTINDTANLQLTVALEHVGENLLCKMTYSLLEADVYFEPYRHVLKRIKEIRDKDFPFIEEIVHLNFDNCTLTHDSIFTLGSNTAYENIDCDMSDRSALPFELGLDDNQLSAFRLAFNKKVALIQGPPGTGKTHLACKIVETFLNHEVKRPILIVCASNQALDKFLTRLLTHSQKIIRLGRQSGSDALQPHVFANLVEVMKLKRYYKETAIDMMNPLLKQSNKILQIIGETFFKIDEMPVSNGMHYAILTLSSELNDLHKDYVDCIVNYFKDDILSKMIDYDYKQKIIAGSGNKGNVLSSCIIEWLALYKAQGDIYERCAQTWKNISLKYTDNEKCMGQLDITNIKTANLWRIPLEERFAIFYKWRNIKIRDIKERIKDKRQRYDAIFRKSDRPIHGDTCRFVKNADIVGLTTCGGAKYQHLIRIIEPRIVIMEEAAEIFESHVITSLVPSVEHLILIGDHEQLKPLPATHELGRDFLLDVSLFERLLKNGAPSIRLTKQYRMRPEIANLLVPYFYKSLESDASVKEYEKVQGVSTNVFFLKHNHLECRLWNSRVTTNDYEARFIASLCKYLLFQGYEQSQITILVTYYGQLSLIRSYIDFDIKELQIFTVDSYQGEENDIVLISFVRSNIYADIGFLSQSDRICVSLSRAKKGLFCIGNFDMFTRKSNLWACLIKRLQGQNMTGYTFPIHCKNHQDQLLQIEYPEEFDKFLTSGCGMLCKFVLPCGHTCVENCHFDYISHETYKCQSPCQKTVMLKDMILLCRKLCWEDCLKKKKCVVELLCGHEVLCKEEDSYMVFLTHQCVEEYEQLQPCGHFVTEVCHKRFDGQPTCYAKVEIQLKCGHIKKGTCCDLQEDHSQIDCLTMVERIGPCGHKVTVPCKYFNDNKAVLDFCKEPCDELLNCGHSCTGFCSSCFSLNIHEICTYPCDLKLPCGHKCEGLCSMPCRPCNQMCDVSCVHSACPNRCVRPCVKCTQPCVRKCVHKKCEKRCWEECLPCEYACEKFLRCGHSCIGMCSDPCPSLCRICNITYFRKSWSGLFVELVDCKHIVEINMLKLAIDDSLAIYEWPSCPICGQSIRNTARFTNELRLAKTHALDCIDVTKEEREVNDLLHQAFPKHQPSTNRFSDLRRALKSTLSREKPANDYLFIIKHCLNALIKLKSVEPLLQYEYELELRTDGIISWITDHLLHATYQQLDELDSVVKNIIYLANKKFIYLLN